VLFTYFWLYATAPLLLDDFCRSGIWLYEPIPCSLLTWLGWGNPGAGVWCWGGEMEVWWFPGGKGGRRWWEAGLAF